MNMNAALIAVIDNLNKMRTKNNFKQSEVISTSLPMKVQHPQGTTLLPMKVQHPQGKPSFPRFFSSRWSSCGASTPARGGRSWRRRRTPPAAWLAHSATAHMNSTSQKTSLGPCCVRAATVWEIWTAPASSPSPKQVKFPKALCPGALVQTTASLQVKEVIVCSCCFDTGNKVGGKSKYRHLLFYPRDAFMEFILRNLNLISP